MGEFWIEGDAFSFSMCHNGQWVGERRNEIEVEYGSRQDFDLMTIHKDDVSSEAWDMLLQILNLEAS